MLGDDRRQSLLFCYVTPRREDEGERSPVGTCVRVSGLTSRPNHCVAAMGRQRPAHSEEGAGPGRAPSRRVSPPRTTQSGAVPVILNWPAMSNAIRQCGM